MWRLVVAGLYVHAIRDGSGVAHDRLMEFMDKLRSFLPGVSQCEVVHAQSCGEHPPDQWEDLAQLAEEGKGKGRQARCTPTLLEWGLLEVHGWAWRHRNICCLISDGIDEHDTLPA